MNIKPLISQSVLAITILNLNTLPTSQPLPYPIESGQPSKIVNYQIANKSDNVVYLSHNTNRLSFDLSSVPEASTSNQIATPQTTIKVIDTPTPIVTQVENTASIPQATAAPIVPTVSSSPTPTPTPSREVTTQPVATYTQANMVASDQLEVWFTQYGTQYNVDPFILRQIAHCESTFRPNATNGPYLGLFQFNSSTWQSNRRAMGLDPNPQLRANPEEAIKTAAFKMGRDGLGAWPSCGRKAYAAFTAQTTQ